MDDDSSTPFRLKDTLSSTLKRVIFYEGCGLLHNKHLGDQSCELLEVLSSARLRSIFLEDVSALKADFTHPIITILSTSEICV